MSTIAADVSEFQVYVTDSYTRQWLILRCCDGGHYDLHADINATWARQATADGRMGGWSAYGVFRPGMNAAVVSNFHRLGALNKVVIDVESWAGTSNPIQGDHSAELNQLADMLAALVGQANVWGYGNSGDLEEIWPSRPQWLHMIVAGYGSDQPTGWANLIGWQYTNGAENHTAMPDQSAPFGACDHNELFFNVHTPLGGGTIDDGAEMNDADWVKMSNLIDARITNYFANGEGNPGTGRIVQAADKSLLKYFSSGEGNPNTGRVVQAVNSALAGTAGQASIKNAVST